MPRMLARVHPPWCGTCRAKPGPDCWDKGRTKRQVRSDERRELREMTDEALQDLALSCLVGGCIDTSTCGGPVYPLDELEHAEETG